MKAHGFDTRGEFKGERVPTLPSWQSSDEGREIYVEDEDKKYYGNNSEWIDYSIAESATVTDTYISRFPYETLVPDNGRFGGTGVGMGRDVSTFTASALFAPYNSGSLTEAGEFIYDNSTNGGAGAALNQTTIDLLAAMGRTSGDARYGTEFYIASLNAGSGTAASATFPGGTRYLMSTNSAASGPCAFFGNNGYATFCGWVRAITGSIGIGAGAFTRFEINGVEQELTNYDLATATGWIFILSVFRAAHGYDSAFPRFYGNDGNSLQIAIPAVFNGYIKNVSYHAPVVSNF